MAMVADILVIMAIVAVAGAIVGTIEGLIGRRLF